MRTVVVLGCGKEKRRDFETVQLPLGPDADSPIGFREIQVGVSYPLVELYTGPIFKDRLRVARIFGGPHWIVSAFLGCRRPDYESGWYERTLPTRKMDPMLLWYNAVVREALMGDTEPGDRLLVLASDPYVRGWRPELEAAGRVVETPLKGLGMGAQRKRCRELRQMTMEFGDG
jgi:hypothetical protein